jgi:hypothetical protein
VLGSTAGEYNSLNQYKPNPRYSDIAKQGDLLSVEDYNQVKNDVLSQLATQPDSNTQDQLIADVPQEQAAISMSDNIEVMEEQVGATKSNTTL